MSEYTCQVCKGVFEKGWSDDEAFAETRENFGDDIFEKNPMAVVCDDCYQKMVENHSPENASPSLVVSFPPHV